MRTLVVEDVRFIGLFIERIFLPYGSTDYVDNGLDAIEEYSRAFVTDEPYDLVCLDILLPKMDGFEVLEKIRKFEKDNDIKEENRAKIIMISTLNTKKVVAKALKAGCCSYITKPFTRKKLLKEVEKLGLIELKKKRNISSL